MHSRPGPLGSPELTGSTLHVESLSPRALLCLPEDGGAGESCIFFKLSSSGLELGAGSEAVEAAGPTVGRVKVKGGLVAAGVSVAEVEASSGRRDRLFMWEFLPEQRYRKLRAQYACPEMLPEPHQLTH